MPSAQQMIEHANKAWNADNLHKIKRAHERDGIFKDGESMRRHTHERIAKNRAQQDIARALPDGLNEMLRALYVHNLERDQPLAIQFAWMPGYDWELQVAECPGTNVSPGGITVIVRGRYPYDTHPSTIPAPPSHRPGSRRKTAKKKPARKKATKKATRKRR